MKLQEIDYVHWLAIKMHERGVLTFEAFKKRSFKELNMWNAKHPELKNIPPIYWDNVNIVWVFLPIQDQNIVEYVELCNALVEARLKASEGGQR